jgi:hypothetical protein
LHNQRLVEIGPATQGSAGGGLKRRLDFPIYRIILGPLWTPVLHGVLATRAYDDGFDFALRLLEATERFRHRLTRAKYRRHQTRLYLLALTMLDKGDRWEDYLMAWKSILERSDLTINYSEESPDVHGAKMLSFIRRRSGRGTAVHFLYPQLHRKELIERKLARARAGRRTGGLLHATAGGLTGEEIKRRLAWIRERAEAKTMEGKRKPP